MFNPYGIVSLRPTPLAVAVFMCLHIVNVQDEPCLYSIGTSLLMMPMDESRKCRNPIPAVSITNPRQAKSSTRYKEPFYLDAGGG